MKRGLLSLAFGLALLPAAVCADTQWTGDVDGDFNKPGNWSGGVPTTATAGVIDKTGEVGISVSESPSAKVGALSLSNADGATTLSVTAPMELEGGKVTIGKDAEVVVGTGGSLSALIPAAANNTDNTETSGIHNGGRLVVDGGTVAFTNKLGHLALGALNNANDKATLEMRSGAFIYHHEKEHNVTGWGFRLFPGSLLKMTGGVFESRCFHNIAGFGGTIDISGDARMYFIDPEYNENNASTWLLQRDLTMRMSGNSVLRNVPAAAVGGERAGEAGRGWRIDSLGAAYSISLEMSGSAMLDVWGKDGDGNGSDANPHGGILEIGVGDLNNPSSRGPVRVSLRENAGMETGTQLVLGRYGGSTGIVEIADNAFITQNHFLHPKDAHGSSYGMRLGINGRSTEIPAVGILKMSGGAVTIVTRLNKNNRLRLQPYGLVVGDGSDGDYDGNIAVGRIEMTGGVISNMWWASASEAAAFILGARSARGEIVQSGGEIVHRGNLPLVIGFSGGEGMYDMAGGELQIPKSADGVTNYIETASNIYVGGASISDAGYDPTNTTDGKYATWADVERGGRLATGTLVVSGGVARTVGDIYVSSHGYGTLEIGKAGSIEAANLYLTNSTVGGVTAPAKLKVTLGESGCGAINLTGACQIAADAECEIDVSAFEQGEEVREIPFLSCGSVEGGFDPANVSVSGRGAGRFKLVQSETGLSVKYSGLNGLMLLVR